MIAPVHGVPVDGARTGGKPGRDGRTSALSIASMTVASALAYTFAFVLLLVVPGPDFALVLRNAGTGGRRAGIATALGVGAGLAVHAVGVALGLGAIIAASATLFAIVKFVGVAYLAYLGIAALWAGLRRPRPSGTPATDDEPAAPSGPRPFAAHFRQGLLCNVLNPKAILVYLALMPQFLPAGAALGATLTLSTITVASAVVWFVLVACTVAATGQVLRRPRVRRSLDALTGTALLAFGARLALARP
ncbi:Threonine efflux protein [Pseudonocardia sp. Ae168_Ps1]|nr:Threonine efflux protein [Pseudonocardia sp. Ae168_Ps1]